MSNEAEFRPLRRARQALSPAACAEVLRRNTSGVLALAGDAGYPYAVPLSYAYLAEGSAFGRILFHSAAAGHKVDAVRRDSRASFCVIDEDRVVPEEFTTYFRSVIVFGRVRILTDDAERRAAIEHLSRRYAPDAAPEAEAAEIERFWQRLCVLELAIDHMSGKQAIELV